MEEIIKSIINMDKGAIQKEEDCKLEIEDMEQTKQAQALAIKGKCDEAMNQEISAYKTKILSEIDQESQRIKEESENKKKQLQERFDQFEESVTEDAYKMILRNLEE